MATASPRPSQRADGELRRLCRRGPTGGGPAPAVVVIQEIFGVNHVVRDVADELAAQGYLAIAPDLFWRIEPGIDITDQTEAEWKKGLRAVSTRFDVDKGVEDIAATIDAVRADPRCDGKVGAVGYCLGGRLAFLTATRTDVDACVSYYGVGIESLLGEADQLTRPLLLHIAEEDGFVPKEAQATDHRRPEGQAARRDPRLSRPRPRLRPRRAASTTTPPTPTWPTAAPQTSCKARSADEARFGSNRAGGPEVLELVEIATPEPGPGEILDPPRGHRASTSSTPTTAAASTQLPLPTGLGRRRPAWSRRWARA